MSTESYFFKLVWTLFILFLFSAGFALMVNIRTLEKAYYQYDVTTIIEMVTPENVTFPAITICNLGSYQRDRYRNGSVIRSDIIPFRISNFISLARFYPRERRYFDVPDYLDFFETSDDFDCMRFNGVRNKSLEASSTEDYLRFVIRSFHIENISWIEYYNYSFYRPSFDVYISDKSLNSFEKLGPIRLGLEKLHEIRLKKELIEIKLPEPYNSCKESSLDNPYHQWNCIVSCIYTAIENKYNCSIPLTLFSIQGLKECDSRRYPYLLFEREFSAACLKECPLEGCCSEKFSYSATTSGGLRPFETFFQFSFSDMSSLRITQTPRIDWFTFMNYVGSGLTLFMIITFPIFVEIFQYIFEMVSVLMTHKK
jgi:hypothetical protein